jgi:CRP/FNR family cyclic AMP-dependent transcriptional regulator
MLTIIDPPQEILDLYIQCKIPVTSVAGIVSSSFLSTTLDGQTDLAATYPSSIVYIRSGIFKYFYSKKLIRFYSTGDFVQTPPQTMPHISIMCEFGAEVTVVKKNDFYQQLLQDEKLLALWLDYEHTMNTVMHAICSLYIAEDFSPISDIRQYDPGATIIREGDTPDMLFELLEGSAEVTVGGTSIGEVNEDEVFGEVSFLTGEKRGATVTATTRCLVQVINRPDLEKFSKFKPALMYKVAQTLATRLTDANRKLLR